MSDLDPDLDFQSKAKSIRPTSKAAWDSIKDHLSPSRQAVITVLSKSKVPLTASEIGHKDAETGKCYWKRVGELVEMCLVEEREERVCIITGQTVLTYALVEHPNPVPLDRVTAWRPSAKVLQAFIREFHQKVDEPSKESADVLRWLRKQAQRPDMKEVPKVTSWVSAKRAKKPSETA